MSNDRPSLIPNSTPLERALEQVLAARLTRYEVAADMLATLWNPVSCPAQYLPWLAFELAVPYWRADWPEQFKRALIADAPAINTRRGHVDGIERGLAAIGLKMEITPWHRLVPEGPPGTFRAVLRVNDNGPLDADMVTDAREMVRATKRQSQHPAYFTAADLDGQISFAPVATVTVMPVCQGQGVQGLHMPIIVACGFYAQAGLSTFTGEAA